MSHLYIPAVWYRARAIVVRSWGWSPVEEEVLLALRARPGTSASVAEELGLQRQVAEAALNRLMRYGLLEVRLSPEPAIAMTKAADEHIASGRPLPERSQKRTIPISIVLDRLGGSIFLRKDVVLRRLNHKIGSGVLVPFPKDEPEETDFAFEQHLRSLISTRLRPGETFSSIQNLRSSIDRRYIEIDVARARDGYLPDRTSKSLRDTVKRYALSGKIPTVPPASTARPSVLNDTLQTTIAADQLVFGGTEHLERFELLLARARSDVFLLSTFVASQNDPKAHLGQERVWAAIESACARGVRLHLFFGSSLDHQGKHAQHLDELRDRLSSFSSNVFAHSATVRSHAKLLIADDGREGANSLVGSCNWLQSPYQSHELSVELRCNNSSAACLEIMRAITKSVPTARSSRDAMQQMQSSLQRVYSQFDEGMPDNRAVSAELKFLDSIDHLPLLRHAAHNASSRLVCVTSKLGAPMVPNLLDPAQIAGERIGDVLAVYSVPTGPVKNRDIQKEKALLKEGVNLERSRRKSPLIHAKALLWDNNDVVVTSFNWGSQSGSASNRLDEIGVHLRGDGLAEQLNSILKLGIGQA